MSAVTTLIRTFTRLQGLCVAALCVVLLGAAATSLQNIAFVYRRAAELNAALFFPSQDGTTYVRSGDINAMWLRDSSVQTVARVRDPDRALIRGVILRQERLIVIDPYANAFRRNYSVAERKFELDSLCYPVRLWEVYAHATRDSSIFDRHLYGALQAILHVVLVEQHHTALSRYHLNQRPIKEGIGLVWSAYRPSDDPQAYNYNIPENLFAAKTLGEMAAIFEERYHDSASAGKARRAAAQITRAVARYGVFTFPRFGRIYAYAVDGLGHATFMDDANTPSLLSIPLFSDGYDKKVYAATRSFVLSGANPYYYVGRYAEGIGSAHTPRNYVWPLALIIEYRTATSSQERERIVRELALSNAGDGVLHESFDVNNPRHFTRSTFGWVNALFEVVFLNRQ